MTVMSDPKSWPPHIQQRYGVGTNVRTRVIRVIVPGIIVAFIAFVFIMASRPKTTFELTAFAIGSDNEVSVQWQVSRPDNTESYCIVRAQDALRHDVGYATVHIPAGESVVATQYALRTESRAITAEVLACGPQSEVAAPAPNFAPGVAIPSQQPPGVAPSP